MAEGGGELVKSRVADKVGDVAAFRSDVEKGALRGEKVVDLAGMGNADKRSAHDDDLEVRSGEDGGQAVERLVTKEDHVGSMFLAGAVAESRPIDAAADKAKADAGVFPEKFRGLDEGIERMAGGVVASVHDDELVLQLVFPTETLASGGVEGDFGLRPEGNDVDFCLRDAFGEESFSHVGIEDDDARGAMEAPAGCVFKQAGEEGIGLEPTEGDDLVGVEVHDPRDEAGVPAQGKDGTENGDERRGGESNDDIGATEEKSSHECGEQEREEVDDSAEGGGVAEAGVPDANDIDAAPSIVGGVHVPWSIVIAAGGENGDLVTATGQLLGKSSQILAGGLRIGCENLIDQQDAHPVSVQFIERIDMTKVLARAGGARAGFFRGRKIVKQTRCHRRCLSYDYVMIVSRPKLSWFENLYLPGILQGMTITARHFIDHLTGRRKVTMQYPEEKWPMPEGYRGAPTLVHDEEGREKCVSCQLCEFICPPRAIRIKPGEIPLDSPHAKVEKAPKEFDIDMIRCIYCGLCEEVCPEEAIFLLKDYAITGLTRAEMVHDKAKLYELGGTLPKPIHKWDENK